MVDKAETPKKVVVESSKCFVGFSPSGTNERVFILKYTGMEVFLCT